MSSGGSDALSFGSSDSSSSKSSRGSDRASPKSSRPSKRRPPPAPPRRSRRSRSPATPLALRSPSPVNRSPGPCPSSTSSSSSSSRSRSRRRRRSSSDSQSSSSPSGSSPSSRCDPVPSSRYWSQSSPRRRQPPDRRDAYRARGGGSRRRAVDMHEDDDTSGHRWVAALHGDEREYDQRRGRGAGAGGAADDISEARRGGAAVDARVTARGKTAGGRRQQQRERGGRDMRDVDEGEGVQRRSAGARRPQRREGGARERRDLDEGEGGQRRAGRHDSVEDGGERDGVADARRRESGRDATGRQPRSTSNNGEREGGVDATWPGAHSSGEGSFKAQPRVGSGGAGADGEDVAMSRDEHCHSPRHRNDSTAGRRRYPPDVGAAPREPRASGSWQPSGSLDGRGQRSGGAAVLDRPKRTPRPRSPPPPPKRARGYSNVPDEPVSRHRGPASHFKRGYSPMPAETVSRHQGPPSPPRRTPPPPRREGNSRGSRWAAAPEALPPPPLPPPPHPAEALRPNGGANSGGPSAQQQFGLSGVLAADTKRNAHGKVVKYSEPADKAVPTEQWRIYTFKDGGAFDKTRMISLLCRLHTDIDVGYHVGHLHCRDTPSALPLALAVRNSTVFKSPGRTALLLGDWSCVPSRLYSDPCREQNCSRSIAALNIEPLGSEFWGRVTWHRRVILGVMRRWYRVQASCLARHPPVPRRSLLCVAHFAENEQRALFGKDSALNGIVRSLAYMYICLGQVFGEVLTLRGRSCVHFGKDPAVNGIVLAHPSISKQHAVIQFRRGSASRRVEPWIMDLESVNKTYLYAADLGDWDELEPARYYRLYHDDRFKFAKSTRDYVIQDVSQCQLDL